jgi:hypothetical protein
MRKILLMILVIVSFQAFGQNPTNYQYRTVRERLIAMMTDSGLHFPRYNTTPFSRTGISTHSGQVGIDTINHGAFFLSGDKWRNFGSLSFETKLLNGGIVTWDSVLKFTVSPAVYYINGAYNTSSSTSLTLDAAHATLDRIDLIYLDSSGAKKITGTAAASPAEPNLPPNSIRLTAVQVSATVTSPSLIDTLMIYDENVEWTGAATSVTTDFNGTTNPCHFVKTTDLGAVTSASYIEYTRSSALRISDYTVLKFYLRLKATFAANTQLQISWRRGGVLKSTSLNLASGNYGYLRSASGCQLITIPMSAFSFLSDSIDAIRFQFTGSNASGCYLDFIQIQSGIIQTQPGQGSRFAVSGEDAVATQNRYFNGRDTYFFSLDSILSFALAARETRFKNIAGSNWLQYTSAGLNIDPLSTSIPLNFNNIPYNSSAGLVHLAIDTTVTPHRLYRKTASGSTPTLQQVLDAGSTLTSTETILTGSDALQISGSSTPFLATSTGSPAASLTVNPANFPLSVPILVLHRTTTGTAPNNIAGGVHYYIENASGIEVIANEIEGVLSDVTNGSETSQLNVFGLNAGAREAFMNIQKDLVRVNNNADTLATKAYARSVGGSGGGEANTASNLAGNGIGIWKDKSGVDLRFKRLKAGDGIGITDNTDSVTISSTISISNNEPWYQYYLTTTGAITADAYHWAAAGTGASIANFSSSSIPDGWLHGQIMSTGTTSTGWAYHYAAATPGTSYGIISINTSYRYNYGEKIRFEDLSDGTETYTYFTGFIDDVTSFGAVVDGAGFRYAHTDSSGAWIMWTKSNSTLTEDAAATTVAADTDYELEITIIGGVAYFYINKTLAGTIGTNVPSGSTRNTTTGNSFEKSAGTTARLAYIEWMAYGKRRN